MLCAPFKPDTPPLQTLLPEYFGHMDASYWARRVDQPDHIASEHDEPSEPQAAAPSGGSEPPSAETLAIMRQDPHMRAEFELYERANDVLSCKLLGCGLTEGGADGTGTALSAEGAGGGAGEGVGRGTSDSSNGGGGGSSSAQHYLQP